MKNVYSNFRKLVPFAVVAIVVSMLASCSSSNQMASSFSKRKYMPGRYSDPIAKVKVEGVNTVNVAANDNKKAVNENSSPVVKEEGKVEVTSTTTPAKSDYSKADKKSGLASKAPSQNQITAKSEVPTSADNNNIVEETSNTVSASPSSVENVTSDNGGHHHYLAAFFICLLLWLLFLILAAASAVGGSGAGLGLFAILAYIMLLAAVVFLVLWIISLAQ